MAARTNMRWLMFGLLAYAASHAKGKTARCGALLAIKKPNLQIT